MAVQDPPVQDPHGAGAGPAPAQPRDPRHGRLLRLAVSCPRCGSRPALRITEEVARGVAEEGAQRVRLGTYQCHRRGCGTIYDLYVTRTHLDEETGGAV